MTMHGKNKKVVYIDYIQTVIYNTDKHFWTVKQPKSQCDMQAPLSTFIRFPSSKKKFCGSGGNMESSPGLSSDSDPAGTER